MLKFNNAETGAMGQASPEAFILRVLQHLIDEMPDLVRGIPPELQYSQIEVAIERARSHGLTTDADVMAFVAVMHEICPNFDEEPTLKAVLDGGTGTPAQRWQALFVDTPALALAWERAAYPTFYDYRAWLPADER